MMKKLLSIVFLILWTSLLSSCFSFSNKVVRWPDRSQEQQSRSLELEKKDNIFQDFLWTSPPMSARKIQSEFSFNGEDFKYTLENQLLELAYQGDSYSFELSTSDKDIYPNIGYLEEKSRIIQSWVPKTEIVAETVAVSKTRTVPVTSTDMDGNISTSFQTEFYTDFETRFVPKTSWQWESHTEYYYEVPSFQYYLIDLGEIPFILYALEEQGEPELFLQNPSYLLGSEINQGFWGDKDVNLLFIDSNNNGIYLEEQDHMLFNSWNPYDPNSHYQEISQVMDNLWYFTRDLKDNLFMDFSLEGKTLHIDYLNEEFVGNENIGEIDITNLKALEMDGQLSIEINSRPYRLPVGDTLKAEYGHYKMVVSVENQLDYVTYFTIDETNPIKLIDYSSPGEATLLEIKNIFSSSYFIVVSHQGEENIFYNKDQVNIPLGDCRVSINVGGFVITKDIHSIEPETLVIDYEEELKNL